MLVYLSIVDRHKPAGEGHIGSIIVDVPQFPIEDTHYSIVAKEAAIDREADVRHYVGVPMTREQVRLMDEALANSEPARLKARIEAVPVTARNLKPGDLFSVRGPEYWNHFSARDSVGESVYVRTNMPAEAFPDLDSIVFRITIVREVIR